MCFLTLKRNYVTYKRSSLSSRNVRVCDKGEYLSMRDLFRRIICTCVRSHVMTGCDGKWRTAKLLIMESQGVF
jgi:hypothetical protein